MSSTIVFNPSTGIGEARVAEEAAASWGPTVPDNFIPYDSNPDPLSRQPMPSIPGIGADAFPSTDSLRPLDSPAAVVSKTWNYDVVNVTDPNRTPDSRTAATKGYYSKYNTQGTQTFGGAVTGSLANAALRALPDNFKTNVSLLSDFRLGTFLRRNGNVSGDQASLINGVIDFLRTDKDTTKKAIVPKFTHSTRFIPIVIKTEFNLKKKDAANTGREPHYIIFDSTPESITMTKSANWIPKDFYGRPEPIQIYGTSSPVDFSLTGTFFSDSASDHVRKMALENTLFALVTPSKNHFMPSPVEVRIGEWKRLRCIVKNVTIESKGPWRTASSNSSYSNDMDKEITTQSDPSAYRQSLMSHSPYIYTVTFAFTVVSEMNTVQFAEDIVDFGFSGGYNITKETSNIDSVLEANESAKDSKYKNASIFVSDGAIAYNISGAAGDNGTLVNSQSTFLNTTKYLNDLGLPPDSNGASNPGALAGITTGLTAIVQTSINNRYGNQITKIFGK